MINIIERLDRKRFSPAVCVLKKGGSLDDEVERLGIPFIEAPFEVSPKPYTSLMVRAWRAARIFRPYRFDLWHSFHYSSDYTEPIIARFAGASAWVFTKKNMGWGSRAWRLRSLLASRIAAQNTDMLKQFFHGNYLMRKTVLVPRGVDTGCFLKNTEPFLHLRSKLGIGPEKTVAACVAHMVPVKGHPTLLEAIARTSDIHLLLAGKLLDSEYVKGLKQQIRQLAISDRVHFLGDVTDIPALHAETDIFILPTWARWRMEGCPVALLEAMACGKACIATDIPGTRDILEAGRYGSLIPPENTQALTDALNELSANAPLRRDMGSAARQRVEQFYTIEQEVETHEALYSEILGMERCYD